RPSPAIRDVPPPPSKSGTTTQKIVPVRIDTPMVTQPGKVRKPNTNPQTLPLPAPPIDLAAVTAARKLQDAVDEPQHLEEKLLDLNEEFIYVEGRNLLALEDTLTYRVEPIYDSAYQRKIDTVKIFGKGSLAISTSIEPLTLRVTREYPLSISSNALVAWTGNLIPQVMDDQTLQNVMIETADDSGFKIRFEGDGVVVSEQ